MAGETGTQLDMYIREITWLPEIQSSLFITYLHPVRLWECTLCCQMVHTGLFILF